MSMRELAHFMPISGTLQNKKRKSKSYKKREVMKTERFIDSCMSVVLTGWMILLMWYAASTIVPGVLG